MPAKKGAHLKETGNSSVANADTDMCDLTVASLEATLHRFFGEAEKQSKERFERLETQLDFLRKTLDKHTEDLNTQRTLTTSLQAQLKRVESSATEHLETIKKLQDKVTLMEDHNRRNNLRIINLKEGEEQGNVLSYLISNLPKWFMELKDCSLEIMRAHRIGPPRRNPAAPPRTVILNFLRFSDRDKILGMARKTPVVVAEQELRFAADFSDVTAQRRKSCYSVMNRARSLGLKAFLLYPAVIKLTRGSDINQFDNPDEAVKYLESIDTGSSSISSS